MKENKGITLIALIITIIILLILVGVSVNLLIKGNLFDSAEKAVNGTNAKVEEQQTRVDEMMGVLEETNDKISKHNWEYTDNTRAKIRCTCLKCQEFSDGASTGRTLSIGQEINYKMTGTAVTSISGEKSGVATGITKGDLKSADYGTDGIQTMSVNKETKWVIFGYEDQDGDGLNETLLITTEQPTSDTVCFYGAEEYNNGVEEVNRMCKELYGSNARGITMEEIDRALGFTPIGGMYWDDNKNLLTTGNFTTKLKNVNTWDIVKANGTNTPNGINTEEALGNYELSGYFYNVDSKLSVSEETYTISANIADTVKATVFGTNCDYYYWLASRGVFMNSKSVLFGTGFVSHGQANSFHFMFDSDGHLYYNILHLRPIVPITSEIPIVGNVLFSTFTIKK